MEVIKSTEQFAERTAKGDKITIAVFRAEWCGDCHFIDPFINDIAKDFDETVDTFAVDIEETPLIAQALSVVGIPSFVAFRDGKEINRFVSRVRKQKDEIEQFYTESISK